MVVKDAFTEKAQKEIENKAFSSIKSYGLLAFAEDAHERFMASLQIAPTRETRNAYFLQFNQVLHELGDNAPEAVEATLKEKQMRAPRILNEMGSEYIGATSVAVGVTNDLYAASMAAPAIRPNLDLETHKALIGEDAIAMISTSELFYDDGGRMFQKQYTSPQTKALHLAETLEQMEQILDFAKLQLEEQGIIEESTATFGQGLINHMGTLALRPNRSKLEASIAKHAKDINAAIHDNPIAGKNVLFSILSGPVAADPPYESLRDPTDDSDEPSNE